MSRGDERYQIAAICVNGHCQTSSLDVPIPEDKYCVQCGAAVITRCPSCGRPIRGDYYAPGAEDPAPYRVPVFCLACGKPFPWVQAALTAVKELIEEEEELDEQQGSRLISSLPDLVAETPRTQVALVRLKKAMAASGRFTAEGLRQFAMDFGCEPVRKQIGLR